MSKICIIDACRTPLGGFMGTLSSLSAVELGAACLSTISLPIESLIMGCVLPAGLGQAPTRQVLLKAGRDHQVPTVTVNKVCGSGMASFHYGMLRLLHGDEKIVGVGGMESMSNAPLLQRNMREWRFGHGHVYDHMLQDGLEDHTMKDKPTMGLLADRMAEEYGISREDQDMYAQESLIRAKNALSENSFSQEIIGVKGPKGLISSDELPLKLKVEKISQLLPAFRKEGTITAATSSAIADGAAVLSLTTEAHAKKLGVIPIARVVAVSEVAIEPAMFTRAPIYAIRNVLAKADWAVEDVDLFEINEAFAVVPLAAIRALCLDHDKVNIHGGACALGHPLGASGARVLVTLVHALRSQGKSRGVASVCIGGGESIAVAVECC